MSAYGGREGLSTFTARIESAGCLSKGYAVVPVVGAQMDVELH